jgi:hypothetical protein
MDSGDKAVFLFGPADLGVTGDFLLTEPAQVARGGALTLNFNIDGTVAADAGPPRSSGVQERPA